MCGRAKLPTDVSELKLDLKIEWDKLGDYRPRWNATPTSDLPVVISINGERTLTAMRWDDLSIWTTTSARAGVTVNADIIIAAANTSRLRNTNFMVTPCSPFLMAA